MKNLVRELSILRQLTQMSNNIFTIKLHDVILPANSKHIDKIDHIFLVTDFMESDIQKLVQVTQPDNFDSSHLIAIIYNILCAINFLHSAGVMHRDLKSENILIDDECRVKICDFGMARTTNSGSLETDYPYQQEENGKQDGTVKRCLTHNVCTRWYRAPELFLLQNHYDSKIDMWGFGCILYEMTFLNVNKEVGNTDKILFISEEEQENILSESSAASSIKYSDDLSGNKIDSYAVKNILKIIGRQSEQSLSFINSQNVISSIIQMQKNHKSPKILKKLEHSDPTVNSLLLQLLKFNPNQRWSTTEALKMPMFDSVRIKELEQPAPFKIRIPMDEESHIKS